MATSPDPSAKNDSGEFARFKQTMTRLMAVPHAEVKAKLDAEKRAKQKVKRASASRDSA